MPVQERENPTAEQAAEAQRRKQELQEQNIKKSEKLLPFLKVKVEQHRGRIASLDDKITAREAKITASMDKIAKLTAKADRLEDTNKTLKALVGNLPLIKGIIERNEKKIQAIREEKIPKAQEKIEFQKGKISELHTKRDKVQHKLDKALSLNSVIRSFGIGLNQERRQVFTEALQKFQQSSIACMGDKLDGMKAKRQELYEQYNAPETSAVDKLELQKKINSMTEKIEALTDKMDSLADRFAEPKTEQEVEEEISETAGKLAEVSEREEVTMPEISEAVLGDGEDAPERQALMSVEIFGELRYFKVDEQSVDDILKASQADKPLLKLMEMGEQVSAAEYAEIQQSDKFTFSVEMNFDNDSVDIYSVNEGKGGIAESDRSDENTTITTVRVSEIGKEQSAPVVTEEKTTPAQTAPKQEGKEFIKVNPEYYASLQKNDRSVNPMPKNIAEQVMNKLGAMNVPFSAVERKGGLVAVTVSKENEGILKAVEKQARTERGKQLVNPDFFKSLPREERFTQRMTEQQAEAKVAELSDKGIACSAVLDGERSGVTVHKKDVKEAFFSVKQFKQKAAAKSRQKTPPQEKQQTRKRTQGLE